MVCASEEVAKKLAPEETADAEIMLREQAGIVSGPVRSVMDAAFAAKRAALTVDLLVQNLSPTATEAVKEQLPPGSIQIWTG